eukprot:1049137-Pleurochrysis_carterae.AAC.1
MGLGGTGGGVGTGEWERWPLAGGMTKAYWSTVDLLEVPAAQNAPFLFVALLGQYETPRVAITINAHFPLRQPGEPRFMCAFLY